MSTPMIFIRPELRPELAGTYDIEPVGIEDAIRDAVARGESLDDKKDGVDRRFLEDGGAETRGSGQVFLAGVTGKETCDTGKEACDALRVVVYGEIEAVHDFIRPII
ncbi:hypothetical protein [Streptomyces sp. NPDC127100]|uniref:hypothetical protein n=1 Tax=Streptomyces sp. NPDC127100 TaxID=3347138 RepID=UPI003653F075